jgi:molybdate transport system substrate-binding protein
MRPVAYGLIAWLLLVVGCGPSPPPDAVVIFAAASTREPLEKAAAEYQARHGRPVRLNFGPSSALARQIEKGAEADLFLSADVDWVEYLRERDLVVRSRQLLTNRLVVVVPAGSDLVLQRLPDLVQERVHRLALAGPAVPAGKYAREALRSAGVWAALQGRVLDGADVRAALLFVERAEADAGVVYATDIAGSERVRVAFAIPANTHAPIRYPLALLRRETGKARAEDVYKFMTSAASLRAFEQAGFGTLPDEPDKKEGQ